MLTLEGQILPSASHRAAAPSQPEQLQDLQAAGIQNATWQPQQCAQVTLESQDKEAGLISTHN